MRQVDCAGDVGVDYAADLFVLVDEAVAKSPPGIETQKVDIAIADPRDQLVDTLDRRQIGLDGFDRHAVRASASAACWIAGSSAAMMMV
jgi:hypothetical protein